MPLIFDWLLEFCPTIVIAVFPFYATIPFFIIVYVVPLEVPVLKLDAASKIGAPKFTFPDAKACV